MKLCTSYFGFTEINRNFGLKEKRGIITSSLASQKDIGLLERGELILERDT